MSNNKTNNIEEIDLLELAFKLLRKWYVFVVFGVLFSAFAIYYVFSTPSTYSTSGTVLIRSEQGIPNIMGIDASLASNFLDLGISSDVNNEKLIFIEGNNWHEGIIRLTNEFVLPKTSWWIPRII